jgi:DNA-binding GntR family transcriptional regulator
MSLQRKSRRSQRASDSMIEIRSGTSDSPDGSARALPNGVNRIVETIIRAVCTRRLPPSAKLGETQLAEVFGVSRTIVRQALQHLSFMGITRSVANRGTFVMHSTRKQAADLFAARRVIEAETVALLARDCTARDIRTLREHVARERQMEATGNALELAQLRGDFHMLIARLAGNKVLAEILESLLPQTALIRAFYGSSGHSGRPTDEHEKLIKLLAKGDTSGCIRLIHEHLALDEASLRISNEPSDWRVDLADAFRGTGGHSHPRP